MRNLTEDTSWSMNLQSKMTDEQVAPYHVDAYLPISIVLLSNYGQDY